MTKTLRNRKVMQDLEYETRVDEILEFVRLQKEALRPAEHVAGCGPVGNEHSPQTGL